MRLKLIVQKNGSNQELIEFKELPLASVLSALFNHHSSQNPNDRMSVNEAEQLIQDYEGQQQFFLHHVTNQDNSRRSFGVVVRGRWSNDNFSATEIQIEEETFKLGFVRKEYRTAGKFRNDSLPLTALLKALIEQDERLSSIGFIEEVAPVAHRAVEAVAGVKEPSVAPKLSITTKAPQSSPIDESELPLSPHNDQFNSKFTFNFDNLHSDDKHSYSSESEENNFIRNGRKSLDENTTQFNQLSKNRYRFFDYLKWPTVAATLAYCAAQALHATRLIAGLAIGTTATVWAGAVFILAGIIQTVRESLKTSSYNSYSEGKASDEGLQKNLPTLSSEAWQSFKDGFDAQKSIVNQFKSTFRPSNYTQAKPYYAGYYLSEHNPNFNLDDIENKRKLSI